MDQHDITEAGLKRKAGVRRGDAPGGPDHIQRAGGAVAPARTGKTRTFGILVWTIVMLLILAAALTAGLIDSRRERNERAQSDRARIDRLTRDVGDVQKDAQKIIQAARAAEAKTGIELDGVDGSTEQPGVDPREPVPPSKTSDNGNTQKDNNTGLDQARRDLGLADRFVQRILAAATATSNPTKSTKKPKPTMAVFRPVDGRITSGFGFRRHPTQGGRRHHNGIDFKAHVGDPVRAARAGRVVASGWRGGYGKVVDIDHGGGVVSRYAHNSRTRVAVGDAVKAGQVIAAAGSTGNSTGPHVHFEVIRNGRHLDPLKFLAGQKTP